MSAKVRAVDPAIPLIFIVAVPILVRIDWEHFRFPGIFFSGIFLAAATVLDRPRQFLVAQWIAWTGPAPHHAAWVDETRPASEFRTRYVWSLLLVIFLAFGSASSVMAGGMAPDLAQLVRTRPNSTEPVQVIVQFTRAGVDAAALAAGCGGQVLGTCAGGRL